MIKHTKYLLIFWILCILQCKASMILFPEVDKGDTNWEMKESQHFYIYCRPSSEASRNIEFLGRILERAFTDCSEILNAKYQNKIKCYLYNSVQELQEKQNTKLAGFAMPEFETICYYYPKSNWSWEWYGFRHEIVHVLMYWTVGVKNLDFLAEGIAVAIEMWNWPAVYERLWVHAVASNAYKNNCLFSISQLASNKFFEDIRDEQDTTHHFYEQCGSLVRYLVDEYGIEEFKRFYSKAGEDNYRTIFQYTYDKSIDDFEEGWHEFLRNY